MTTAKNDIFIGLQLENFHLVGAGELTFDEGIKIWCWGGGGLLGGGFFHGGEQIFE